ncbi:MAG: hypothetical protein ABI880_11745, partial [Acidobacteriota bacterium]
MGNRRLVAAGAAVVLCALLSSSAPEARQAPAPQTPQAPARPGAPAQQPTGTPDQPFRVSIDLVTTD